MATERPTHHVTAGEPPRGAIAAADIATKEFLITSKGFDQDEVRHFLSRVALAFQAQESEAAGVRAESQRLLHALREVTRQVDHAAARLRALEDTNRDLRLRLEVAEAVRADALDRGAEAIQTSVEVVARLGALRRSEPERHPESDRHPELHAGAYEPDPGETSSTEEDLRALLADAQRTLPRARREIVAWERRAADARRQLDALTSWVGSMSDHPPRTDDARPDRRELP